MSRSSAQIRIYPIYLKMRNLTPLPFQGDILLDESFMGFVLRMSNRNGISGIHWLLRLLGREKTNHFLSEDVPAIAFIFGADPQKLNQCFSHQERVDGELHHHMHGHRISRPYLVRPLQPQLCPFCLEESGYSRSSWDFSFVCSCPTHECLLLESCPRCLRTIRWGRPHLLSCKCGTPWNEAQAVTPRAPESAFLLAALLEARLKSTVSTVGKGAGDIWTLLAPLSLDVLVRLIWAFGAKDHIASKIRPGKSRAVLKIDQAAQYIENAIRRLETTIASSNPSWNSAQVANEIHLPALRQLARDVTNPVDLQLIGSLIQVLGVSQGPRAHMHRQGVLF